jgi:hypothetical protein
MQGAKKIFRFFLALFAMCVFAAPVIAQTTLGISGDKMTIDGQPKFLLGVSYFDALGWKTSELDGFQARKFNLIRIFMDWPHPSRGFINSDGSLKNTASLLSLVRACAARGIVVEVSILTSLYDAANPTSSTLTMQSRENGVRNTVRLLKSEPNVFYDICNEHDVAWNGATTTITHAQAATLFQAGRAEHAAAILTISSGYLYGDPIYPKMDGPHISADVNAGAAILSPHLPRTADWYDRTDQRVKDMKGYLASIGRNIPVYLQEEQRRGEGDDSTSNLVTKAHFVQAASEAKTAGAAAWVFHTNAGFDMSIASFFSQLDSVELDTINSIGSAIFGTPPTVSITSPANGSAFTAPANIMLSANASDSDGAVSKVEFYRGGTTLIGTDTTSPYSLTWNSVAAGSYALTAKATDNAGGVTTSGAIGINVTTTPVTQILPPTITAPANGAVLSGTSVTISWTAVADAAGYLVRCEDLTGTTPFDPRNTSNGVPFLYIDRYTSTSITTTAVAGRSYKFWIHSVKSNFSYADTTTWSSAAELRFSTSLGTPNAPPTVSITSPANGSTFTAPANVTVNANALDSNGTVTKVDFYNGTTLLGTDTTSPYAFTWTNVAAGSYSLSAKATDNLGAVGTSNTVTITVAASVSNDAAAGIVSIPTAMTAGRTYAVSVAMRNSGTSTWTAAAGYKLGSQNPQDNTTWGTNRLTLAATDAIAPGQTKTFAFNVTAPITAKAYNFQWRMVQEGVQWFGALSTNVSVTVSPDGGGSGSGTLNIAPEADTYIDQFNPSENYASSTSFSADGGPTGKLRKAYLRFNVTGLPTGAVVTDARLILVCRNTSALSGGRIRKFQPTNASWAETGPTWEDPLAGENASDILSTLGAVTPDTAYAFTNLASAVLANGRVTFKISSTEVDGAAYYSKEHTTAAQRPVLRISYATAALAPSGNG